MDVQIQHLATFLRDVVFAHSVYAVDLEYTTTQGQRCVRIDLRAGHPVGFEEMELLHRVFRSIDIDIPAWHGIYEGCETCGHNSIANLSGMTINDVCTFEESVREAALIKWEQELDLAEAARLASIEQQRRIREREERRKAHVAQVRAIQKLKEQQEELFKNNLEDEFQKIWNIIEPLMGMKQKEFSVSVSLLPNKIKGLLFRLRKTPDQSYAGVRKKFFDCCNSMPKKMKKELFPDGRPANLAYRFIRRESDAKTRTKQRNLELEGFKVFLI